MAVIDTVPLMVAFGREAHERATGRLGVTCGGDGKDIHQNYELTVKGLEIILSTIGRLSTLIADTTSSERTERRWREEILSYHIILPVRKYPY